jgi:hypothetical protein
MFQNIFIASIIKKPAGPVITATWDPATISTGSTLSNGNLHFTSNPSSHAYYGAKSTNSHSSGKYYFEATLNLDAFGDLQGVVSWGVRPSSWNPGTLLSTYGDGYPQFSDGNWTDPGQPPVPVVANQVIGIAVDLDAGKAWARSPSGWLSQDPTLNGVSDFPFTSGGSLIASTQSWGNDTVGSETTVNFGATAFAYPIPAGYTAWGA